MKLVALGAVFLSVGCRDRPPTEKEVQAGSGSAPTAPADARAGSGVDACALGLRALDGVTCPPNTDVASVKRARQQLAGIVQMLGSGGVAPQQQQIACAQMIVAIDRDAAELHCSLALAAGDRAAIGAMLDAWYAQRTPVAPSGDAAADAVIARIASIRDAACACSDATCLDRVQGQFDSVGTFAANAPQAARDLGNRLVDDIGRCAARVRLGPQGR